MLFLLKHYGSGSTWVEPIRALLPRHSGVLPDCGGKIVSDLASYKQNSDILPHLKNVGFWLLVVVVILIGVFVASIAIPSHLWGNYLVTQIVTVTTTTTVSMKTTPVFQAVFWGSLLPALGIALILLFVPTRYSKQRDN